MVVTVAHVINSGLAVKPLFLERFPGQFQLPSPPEASAMVSGWGHWSPLSQLHTFSYWCYQAPIVEYCGTGINIHIY